MTGVQTCALPISDRPEDADWDQGDLRQGPAPLGHPTPPTGARFADLPACALQSKNYAAWAKSLAQYLYQQKKFTLLRCPAMKLTSHPGETEGDFRVRIREALRAERDKALAGLREKHAAKVAPLESKIRTAEGRVAKETSEYQEAKMQSMLSTGASVLGALLGTRRISVTKIRSVGTAMGRMSRAGKQRDDIGRAKESLDALRQQRDELQAKFAEEMAQLQAAPDENDVLIEEIALPPRKSDIAIEAIRLAWVPTH